VRDHDPHAALAGGDDGLTAYRQIIALLPRLSHANTRVIFEIGYDQATNVPELCQAAGMVNVTVRHDLAESPRCVIIKR